MWWLVFTANWRAAGYAWGNFLDYVRWEEPPKLCVCTFPGLGISGCMEWRTWAWQHAWLYRTQPAASSSCCFDVLELWARVKPFFQKLLQSSILSHQQETGRGERHGTGVQHEESLGPRVRQGPSTCNHSTWRLRLGHRVGGSLGLYGKTSDL